MLCVKHSTDLATFQVSEKQVEWQKKIPILLHIYLFIVHLPNVYKTLFQRALPFGEYDTNHSITVREK